MTSLPLVSIVTPSFNQVAYLEKTMLSVLNQDYPRLEYWVMDGASTDGSVEIIQSYASRLAGWLSEKDRGQADGVNKGFARATGEIVGWLNSDDLYTPGAIASAVRIFEEHPQASFVFSDVDSIDEQGRVFNQMHYGAWGLAELMALNIIGQPGVFMRRQVLEEAGFLDLSYNYLLDVQLWLKMASLAEPVYAPGQVWAQARMHAQAKNIAAARNFAPEAMRLAEWICSDPRFAPLNEKMQGQILSGAHRLAAFYQVEAGDFGDALRSYRQMLQLYPHWPSKNLKRMTYALFGACGLAGLRLGHATKRENNPHK